MNQFNINKDRSIDQDKVFLVDRLFQIIGEIYPIADLFIVQWEEMLKLYPKAVYGGAIY